MPEPPHRRFSWNLALDSWAVLLGLGLALLVHFGILKTVPW